jgi:hypothetical protein
MLCGAPPRMKEFRLPAGQYSSVVRQQHPEHRRGGRGRWSPLAVIRPWDRTNSKPRFYTGLDESRAWSPISFASTIALWASADVAGQRKELRSGEDGTAVSFGVTAQRKSGRMVPPCWLAK